MDFIKLSSRFVSKKSSAKDFYFLKGGAAGTAIALRK